MGIPSKNRSNFFPAKTFLVFWKRKIFLSKINFGGKKINLAKTILREEKTSVKKPLIIRIMTTSKTDNYIIGLDAHTSPITVKSKPQLWSQLCHSAIKKIVATITGTIKCNNISFGWLEHPRLEKSVRHQESQTNRSDASTCHLFYLLFVCCNANVTQSEHKNYYSTFFQFNFLIEGVFSIPWKFR